MILLRVDRNVKQIVDKQICDVDSDLEVKNYANFESTVHFNIR